LYFKHPVEVVDRGPWNYKGKHVSIYSVNHPFVLNVYGGITPYGTTKLVEVTSTTNHHPTQQYN
jgi:hypothetical protein